jgi:hypothetical protein
MAQRIRGIGNATNEDRTDAPGKQHHPSVVPGVRQLEQFAPGLTPGYQLEQPQ